MTMGWLLDKFANMELSADVKERLSAIESEIVESLAALERENAELRAKVPPPSSLDVVSERVLTFLFKDTSTSGVTVTDVVHDLELEPNVARYHLDRLAEQKLAYQQRYFGFGREAAWASTPKGRKYIIYNKLV